MDFDALERALAGGPTLLLLCATVILGAMVVPFLLTMWVRAERNWKNEVRELLQKQIEREGQLTEALVTTRETLKSARAAIEANTNVLRAIMGAGSDVGASGALPPPAPPSPGDSGTHPTTGGPNA